MSKKKQQHHEQQPEENTVIELPAEVEDTQPAAEPEPQTAPETQPDPQAGAAAEPQADNADSAAEPASAEPETSADTASDNTQTTATATRSTEQQPKKSGSGLAILALLVAIAALVFSIWLYQQPKVEQTQVINEVSQQPDPELLAQLGKLNQQIEQQQTQLNQLRTQLAELPSSDNFAQQQRALKQMQSNHQAFSMRFEAAFGNTRQDWRLAEAEHLLRMAILRLNAMQDLVSARHLVEGADQILFEQDDVAAYPAREALSQALADIKAMPKLDRTGLFLRLGALQNQISQLDQLMPGFEQKSLTEKATDAAFWQEWLDGMSDYIRLDFHSTDEIRPLLSSQEITHIRLALSLSIEQAQWAALNGQQQAYNQALSQSRALLEYYFPAHNQKSSALLEQLAELEDQPVSQQMPDIQPALIALQAYIHDRTLQYRTRSEGQQ